MYASHEKIVVALDLTSEVRSTSFEELNIGKGNGFHATPVLTFELR